MTHVVGAEQVMQRLEPLELLASSGAARDIRLDHRDIGRVELAIDEAAEQQFLINARRHLFHAPRLFVVGFPQRKQLLRKDGPPAR